MRPRSVWYTLALILVFESLKHLLGLSHVSASYSGAAFGLMVIYASFAQGLRYGFMSLALTVAYHLWTLSVPGHPFTYALAESEGLSAIITASFGTVWLSSGIRHRLGQAARLEVEREAAMVVAEELRTANAELRRLAHQLQARNEHVESLVAQRTEELAGEKALRDRIIQHVPASVIYLDPQLTIRLANEAFAVMMGLPKEQLIGRSFYEMVPHPNPNPRLEVVRETLEPLRASGLPFQIMRDGLPVGIHLDNIYLPVFAGAATLEGILVFAIDVSDRVEIERLQDEQIRNLQEVDRLKGDFINVASHELRTPLTSIRGYAEFLEDLVAGPLTPDQVAYVSQIQEGARRLQRIVDDMLDFARLEAGTFSLVWQEACLGQLIQEELSSLAPQLRDSHLRLDLQLMSEGSWVRMDPQRIGQVVLNLMSNAIKFTPPGGCLTVRTHLAAGMVRVEVTDSGIGIAPENLSRLFEKFYQVDPSSTRTHGGAGLGLAICKAIVD
ncbi:MAG TPA: ATP-binding protein, partial [Stenomitos sp.]